MRLSILTPPALSAAVTWDEVRHHLRLDELDPEVAPTEQSYAMELAAAATRTAQARTRCALLSTSYELDLLPGEVTERPYSGFRYWPYPPYWGCGRPAVLELEWPPLVAVDAITWGEQTLVENTDYWVLKNSAGVPTVPGTIHFKAGLFGDGCFTGCGCGEAGPPLAVQFTAGYGPDTDTVPEDVRAWILLRTGAMYEYREESAEVRNIISMPFADSLLDNVRWFQFS